VSRVYFSGIGDWARSFACRSTNILDVNRELDLPVLRHKRQVFNRKLLVFVHVLVGFLSAVFYLSQIDLVSFPYWRSRAGLGVIFIAMPAIVPYAVSAVYSWRVATHLRLGVWLFLVVLVMVSVLVGLLFSGAFEINIHGPEWLFTVAGQAGLYVWAAELLLHVE